MKTTQNKRVLDYMIKYEGITSLEAFEKLGITRLSARIYDLKNEGHEITRTRVVTRNRYGEKVNVTFYRLKETAA